MIAIRYFILIPFLLMVTLPAAAFDFDAEMGGGRESSPTAMKHKSSAVKSSFDFDAEMSHGRQQVAPTQKQSGDILGSIMGGRADIRDQKSIHSFAVLSQALDQTCHCSISGKNCSGVMNLSSYQTKEYLNKAVGLMKKVENLCFNWAEDKEQSFHSAKKRNQFIKIWKSNKNILSAHQQSLSRILRSDAKQYAYLEQQKQKRIEAKRRRAENNGGFQWGKFAALATGAAIGGLGNLDAQSQTNIVGGMLMDSMEGQEGISNMQGGVNRSNQQIQQRNAENRRTQALYQQAAEERRRQLAENKRLRRLDAENRQRHQQVERAYRQRQIAQANRDYRQRQEGKASQTYRPQPSSRTSQRPSAPSTYGNPRASDSRQNEGRQLASNNNGSRTRNLNSQQNNTRGSLNKPTPKKVRMQGVMNEYIDICWEGESKYNDSGKWYKCSTPAGKGLVSSSSLEGTIKSSEPVRITTTTTIVDNGRSYNATVYYYGFGESHEGSLMGGNPAKMHGLNLPLRKKYNCPMSQINSNPKCRIEYYGPESGY